MRNLLEIKNLVTQFKTESGIVKAVDNVSLTVKPKQTLGIVGESGSGKSVTSLSTMRLIPSPPGEIVSGEILFQRENGIYDLTKLPEKEMKKIRGNEIAMIFQEPMTSLNPVFTCGDQVMEAILLHDKTLTRQSKLIGFFEAIGVKILNTIFKPILNLVITFVNLAIWILETPFFIALTAIKQKDPAYSYKRKVIRHFKGVLTTKQKAAKERTLELFRKVKLPRPSKIFSSYPHQISGGQKQRVMIAMALSCNPSLLIADEPTTALDVTVQKTILQILKDLQSEYGMGIIFITHDLGVIAELADEVAVMYKGKIVEQGTTEDVFLRPSHPYTKGLLACRPPLNRDLKELPTRDYFIKEVEEGKFVQTEKSVEEVLNELTLSEKDRDFQRNMIYEQDPLLEIIDLKTYYPINKSILGKPTDFVRAVDNVSLKLYPGETLGLVGESGCGKTTLGRTILRLTDATSGQIIFEGKDLLKESRDSMRKLRKDVQIIFQDPYSSLNPRIPIGDAIVEAMKVHKVCENDLQRQEEVIMLLERVGLKREHYGRYPHEFSGGQRQRICIARSIALKPKFVICDESVSALDVSVQAEVLNLLNELRDEFGLTYLFISHDLSVVKFMSDRIIVMNQGKIEEEGLAEDIYYRPKTIYTQTLIDSIPKGIETSSASL